MKEIEISKEEIKELHNRYISGEKIKDLSKEMNVAYRTIRKWFLKENLHINSVSESQLKDKNNIWKGGITKRPKIKYKGVLMREYQAIYCQFNNLEKIPDGYVIHHIDGNPSNNNIENLQLLSEYEHKILRH